MSFPIVFICLPSFPFGFSLSSLLPNQVYSFNKRSSNSSYALGAGSSVTNNSVPAPGGLRSTRRGREGLRINVKSDEQGCLGSHRRRVEAGIRSA